jgi:hypothetical protein
LWLKQGQKTAKRLILTMNGRKDGDAIAPHGQQKSHPIEDDFFVDNVFGMQLSDH